MGSGVRLLVVYVNQAEMARYIRNICFETNAFVSGHVVRNSNIVEYTRCIAPNETAKLVTAEFMVA